MPKTSTERSRESRARKTPSVKKPPKTAAERQRSYRARKKALKNTVNEHRIDDVCFVNQESPQQQTDNEVNVCNDKHVLLYNEYQQNSHLGNSLTNAAQGQSIGQNRGKQLKFKKLRKKAKTPAERCREFRARQKALKSAAHEKLIDNQEIDIIVNQESPQHIENEVNVHGDKHSLLYEYLSRHSNSDNEQININRQSSVVQVNVHQQNSSPGNSTNAAQGQGIGRNQGKQIRMKRSRKIAKTPAERCREYRARQRPLKDVVNNPQTTKASTNVVPNDDKCVLYQESSQGTNTAITSADRRREYRLQHKLEQDTKETNTIRCFEERIPQFKNYFEERIQELFKVPETVPIKQEDISAEEILGTSFTKDETVNSSTVPIKQEIMETYCILPEEIQGASVIKNEIVYNQYIPQVKEEVMETHSILIIKQEIAIETDIIDNLDT